MATEMTKANDSSKYDPDRQCCGSEATRFRHSIHVKVRAQADRSR